MKRLLATDHSPDSSDQPSSPRTRSSADRIAPPIGIVSVPCIDQTIAIAPQREYGSVCQAHASVMPGVCQVPVADAGARTQRVADLLFGQSTRAFVRIAVERTAGRRAAAGLTGSLVVWYTASGSDG
jgi:hypothetical protein